MLYDSALYKYTIHIDIDIDIGYTNISRPHRLYMHFNLQWCSTDVDWSQPLCSVS